MNLGQRVTFGVVGLLIRLSLLVSPRPGALIIRRVFAAGSRKTAESLAKHAPDGMESLLNERYGDRPSELLDVYWPATANEPLPVVVWIHGGGFVGGDKSELAGYFTLLASKGYAVVAPNYALAPEHHYPLPPNQVMAALEFAQAKAADYYADFSRIVLAGDSAGAHIAAQIAALATTAGYADLVGIRPTIQPNQIRGVVLCCGVFDMSLAGKSSTQAGRDFNRTVIWAYSGKRGALDDPVFLSASVANHVTPQFPPTLITVGNVDPLREHSQAMHDKLLEAGRNPDTIFFPDDYQPPLDHEYQFNPDSREGQMFFARLNDFLERRLRSI